MLCLFFAAWLIFNGRITLEIVLTGLVVSGIVFAFLCRFMDYSIQKERRFYKKIPLLCRYICLLLGQIIASNLTVFRLILTRKETVEPVLIHVHTHLRSELSRVILANSITLTPGTITVSMSDQDLLVHCLDRSLAEGMEDSVFVKLLEQMEQEEV